MFFNRKFILYRRRYTLLARACQNYTTARSCDFVSRGTPAHLLYKRVNPER